MSEPEDPVLRAPVVSMENRAERIAFWENIAFMVRGFDGKAVEPQDAIDKLTNVRNIFERSRYPTYPILARITYLRLLYWKYGEAARSCIEWATDDAEDLIAYKGLSREEYRDMHRATVDGQQFFFGSQAQQQQEKKKRFWQRQPKQEPSEFKE